MVCISSLSAGLALAAACALSVVVCTVSPYTPARMRVHGGVLQPACLRKVTFTLENGFGAQV